MDNSVILAFILVGVLGIVSCGNCVYRRLVRKKRTQVVVDLLFRDLTQKTPDHSSALMIKKLLKKKER